MKCLILFLITGLLTGCPLYTVCAPPKDVPAVPAYRTDLLPEVASSATVIEYMLTDLLLCQGNEKQLRIILGGYGK